MSDIIEPLLLRHKRGQEILDVRNTKYWELVRQGELEVVGSGAMSRVTYASIKRYVAKLIEQARGKAS